MDDYLPLYRAILRAEKNNKACDKLSFDYKTSYEKIHTKYCKIILGLKKTASNITSNAELGRFPLSSFIKTQVMVYFSRLNTNNINPLVAEALKVNKNVHEEDIYSWYTFANNIFKEFDLNIENYSNIDKSFEKVKYSIKTQLRKVVTEKYRNKFKEKLSSYSDESKLFLYSKLKSSIGLEKYLSELTSFKYRQILAKFRTSDHCLQIETGRYKNIPRQQRLCNICKVVEDECHFLLNCKLNEQKRKELLETIKLDFPDFEHYTSFQKVHFLLNPNSTLLPVVCTFLKQSVALI